MAKIIKADVHITKPDLKLIMADICGLKRGQVALYSTLTACQQRDWRLPLFWSLYEAGMFTLVQRRRRPDGSGRILYEYMGVRTSRAVDTKAIERIVSSTLERKDKIAAY